MADAVATDLQAGNGDKHLRLLYHAEALPVGEDDETTGRRSSPR